ncbi:helix-turn-helix domain-containing protein [Phycisphaerales bacterium AB-hyl4]|uniref:Helix-turn-helix domain-containing protein n=1 Tax=Natronomicrosphaera hydrolytica TaxID=3242702 RepID=A0ABV4U9J4_9BACT
MIRFLDHGWGTLTTRRPIPPCRWDRFDLLCVHGGQLQLRFEHQATLRLGTGTGVLIYPHTRFEGEPLEPRCRISVQHFAIDDSAEELPGVLQRLVNRRNGYEPVQLRPHRRVRGDIQRALALAFEPQTQAVHDMRVAWLTLILGQLDTVESNALPAQPEAWDALDGWLRQHVTEPITVDAMARQLDLSPSHFSHRFRAVFGVSPGRHMQRLRLQEAQRLLRETALPIKAIAQKLYYADLANFYRAFRKAVGITPARYRQRHTLRG